MSNTMEHSLRDFANWLWDIDIMQLKTQLPPFDNADAVVDKYMKIMIEPIKPKEMNETKEQYQTDPDHTKLMLRHSILDRKLEESGKYVRPDVMRYLNEAMEEYANEITASLQSQLTEKDKQIEELKAEIERFESPSPDDIEDEGEPGAWSGGFADNH